MIRPLIHRTATSRLQSPCIDIENRTSKESLVRNEKQTVEILHLFRCSTHTRFHTTEAFTHRRLHRDFHARTLLHTRAFTHRRFYTQRLLHTDAFTHRSFYTQTPLHTDAFTHRHSYTQTLLHTDAFTHRRVYTQRLLHTENLYTQTL